MASPVRKRNAASRLRSFHAGELTVTSKPNASPFHSSQQTQDNNRTLTRRSSGLRPVALVGSFARAASGPKPLSFERSAAEATSLSHEYQTVHFAQVS